MKRSNKTPWRTGPFGDELRGSSRSHPKWLWGAKESVFLNRGVAEIVLPLLLVPQVSTVGLSFRPSAQLRGFLSRQVRCAVSSLFRRRQLYLPWARFVSPHPALTAQYRELGRCSDSAPPLLLYLTIITIKVLPNLALNSHKDDAKDVYTDNELKQLIIHANMIRRRNI
jgi:hypothetical protein